MSNVQGQVALDFGDGTYTFRLTVNGAIELEQKCDAPFTVVLNRLAAGAYKINDVREVIRLGLIGGGLDPTKALKVVRQYVDDRPIAESWPVARAVLMGLMFGFEAEPLGDTASGEAEAATPESPNASTPPPSTETPASSASRLKSLIESRSGNSPLQ